MIYRKRVHLVALSFLGAAACALTLLALLAGPSPTHAAPAATIRYVATSGDDTANVCTDSANPCRTVQHAVNVSGIQANDEIRVASGVYTSASGSVLFIQNTLRVRGGFTTTNWNTPYPDAQPTVLDGEGKDRVVYIYIAAGTDITPTLEGLRLTNGAVDTPSLSDYGGGIYSVNAHPVISACHIVANSADDRGAGVYIINSGYAALIGNTIERNSIASSLGAGGGVFIDDSDNVRLIGNTIYSNTTTGDAGGVGLLNSQGVSLVNNIISENKCDSGGHGPGIFARNSSAHLLNTTIARNTGGDGLGLIVGDIAARVWMTNTILVSHTVGIQTVGAGTVTATHTLWGDGSWANGTDTVGSNIITGTHNWWEEPGFVDPDGGDYHVGTGSGALNVGLDVGVGTDIDGDLRPFCTGPDLGADEYGCCANLNGSLYDTIQDAVRASTSPDDVVKVAGICSGVEQLYGQNQVVLVTRTVTLRGGYTTSDWNTSDPVANPSTLDAAGQGRVVYIAPLPPYLPITVTLEGLRLTRGSEKEGGGIYATFSTLEIDNCWIYDNVAQDTGGGIYLRYGDNSRLAWNQVYGNSSDMVAGIFINLSDDTSITSNQIYSNTASISVGGIGVMLSDGTSLAANRIYDNTAGKDSAGVAFSYVDNLTVTGNLVYANTGGEDGIGFDIGGCNDATFVNNVVAGNHNTGEGDGAGMRISGSTMRLMHTTIARNTGGDGSGLHVEIDSIVALTNTILVDQAVGITVTEDSTGTLHATLWGDGAWANLINAAGNVFTGTDIYGDPAFEDPDSGDYHIGSGSTALNAGTDAGVSTDIDGEPRLSPPDLGADEFVRTAFLPLTLRNY